MSPPDAAGHHENPGAAPQAKVALGDLLAPVRSRLLLACLLEAIGALAKVVPLIALVELARELLRDPVREERVWAVVAVAAGALLLRLLTSGAALTLTHLADSAFQFDVRRRAARRLGHVPLGWFTDRSSGRVKKALTDDVADLHHLVGHAYLELTTAIVAPSAALVYLLVSDWRLTLLTLLPVLVGVIQYSLMMRGQEEQMERYQRSIAGVSAAAVEFVDGIAVVKTFGQAGHAHTRFTRAAESFVTDFWEWVRGMLRGSTVAELALAPFTTLLAALVAGAAFVQAGWVPPADVLPFLVVGVAVAGPFLELNYAYQHLVSARHAAGNIQRLLSTETLPPAPDAPAIPVDARVRFAGVRFGYSGGAEVIRGVDLDLRPGTVTALVGPSGAGKSTLAALLARFWDPTEGHITIGGADLREMAQLTLYQQVGMVLQDIRLVHDSVRENIRMAREGASEEEVIAAARAANIHERIMALPRGYDSVHGEDANLSGGEAQRVAIARALLADTPVVILDEATAYADPDSETAIQNALSRLAVGRTLLVIAHRLRAVTDVDQICVVNDGRIVERGDHHSLLAREGLYAELWGAQEALAEGRTS
ncbi:ABC transporter ATP-binding protein [Streptomyces johnsoniae]|uniref:ABC transporter ATP-binding protein n=1 Tax=Streptomyces johnsoniae TaxID=3075532 RepID=A0ABU2S5V2_9ACTN|nr:ABC transporter ATP-binding protein [Streptomyces sp. DSM 41886]MDT0443010.1 ABC transporter ATP-binding protein [Streptomyces sp. DSM 41886]